jgi:isopentenyl-diphosphate delta-isomerase
MHDDPALLSQRKVDHLRLCADDDVEARRVTTLLEDVHLHHQSLPEVAVADVRLDTTLAGQRLRLPLMISGMTGGADAARSVNRQLARVAARHGMAFGVGSQRAMLRDPSLADSYRVRTEAPDVVLFGNIGAVQLVSMHRDEVRGLCDAIEAQGLCIHLNPGQELIQDHGDRDFQGCLDAIARTVATLGLPVVVKETGCGMSPRLVTQLWEAGVRTVDVSGVGGTTWVGVEALRGTPGSAALGELLWDWGIPTAVGTAWAHRAGMEVIASGGIRHGLDVARAMALGAQVGSAALPWLRAAMEGGEEAADAVACAWERTLRAVFTLTGCAGVDDIRRAPRHLGPRLSGWLTQAG